ncbi:porphobilinogen synthase [Akkermansia muciniphila]|nr:porphobilinogen synthase [Akkermansia muciniphila]
MDPGNIREALREAQLDEAEGADILMVKPATLYLDVMAAMRKQVTLPIAAYHVSGEYLMIKSAAASGWLDERETVLETLISIRRAGADMILTYYAPRPPNGFNNADAARPPYRRWTYGSEHRPPHVHLHENHCRHRDRRRYGAHFLLGCLRSFFSEAYILPVQMTAADGTPLGDFQCRPVPGENGKTLLVFRDADFLRQTTGGMVHSKIILSYKGTPFFEGIVPGPMEAIEIPSGSLPPPSGNSGITKPPGKTACYGIVTERAQVSLYNRGNIVVL